MGPPELTPERPLRPKGYPLGTLVEILTGEQTSTIDCDPATAAAEVPGDFIYRVGTPAEVLLPKLQEVLRRECELPVTFTFRDVNRETLVAQGPLQVPAEPGRPGWIEVYGKTLADTREGVAESGSFAAMLDSRVDSCGPPARSSVKPKAPHVGGSAWHLNPARQDVESQYGETEVLADLFGADRAELHPRETRPAPDRDPEIGLGRIHAQDRPRGRTVTGLPEDVVPAVLWFSASLLLADAAWMVACRLEPDGPAGTATRLVHAVLIAWAVVAAAATASASAGSSASACAPWAPWPWRRR